MMEIRKLRATEVELFREIRMESTRLHPEAFCDCPEEMLGYSEQKMHDFADPSDSFPQKFILGAFENDRLLGVVGFFREESIKERHRGYVWSVYTRPEARGKGVSRALMEALIAEARKIEGLEFLALDVSTTQQPARNLYLSLGFFVTGKNPCIYKMGETYVDNESMLLKL
ncbi:MAG: GNAT family N-acetyltransferase [Candidatus Zixiibacteriota bacterium]